MNRLFLNIPYRWKIEQSTTRQHNGIMNSETEMLCESTFVKIIWNLLSKKRSTTLRVRSSGNVFHRNYQRIKGEEDENLLK